MSSSTSVGKRNLVINAGANFLCFGSQLVVAFFVSPILIHGLGDRRYGAWSLVESVLAYLTLFDLGIAAAVVRYIARFEAHNDQKSLNKVFCTSLFIFALAGLCVLGICLALVCFWSRPLGVPADIVDDVRLLLLLLGANVAIGLPLGTFSAALDGLGRYPAKTLIRTFTLVIWMPLAVLAIRAGAGLTGLALVITFTRLVEHLGMVLATRRYLPFLRLSPRFVNMETFRMIRGYSLSAFAAMVAGRISFQTDAIVIGAFLLPEDITHFVIAARLVEYLKDSIRAITTTFTPAFSALDAHNDRLAITHMWLNATRYILYLVLPAQLGVILLGKPFLSLWLGATYAEASYPTLVILALPIGLLLSQSVSARLLYGTGHLRWFAIATIAEAVGNLALSLFLVKRLGIEGVAWGTAVPNLFFSAAVAVYVLRSLNVSVGKYLLRSFLGPLMFLPLPAAAWFYAGRVLPTSWVLLCIAVACALALYALVCGVAEFGPSNILRTLGGKKRESTMPVSALADR
jgi:O-antigen/teichoic acid export membrane protein